MSNMIEQICAAFTAHGRTCGGTVTNNQCAKCGTQTIDATVTNLHKYFPLQTPAHQIRRCEYEWAHTLTRPPQRAGRCDRAVLPHETLCAAHGGISPWINTPFDNPSIDIDTSHDHQLQYQIIEGQFFRQLAEPYGVQLLHTVWAGLHRNFNREQLPLLPQYFVQATQRSSNPISVTKFIARRVAQPVATRIGWRNVGRTIAANTQHLYAPLAINTLEANLTGTSITETLNAFPANTWDYTFELLYGLDQTVPIINPTGDLTATPSHIPTTVVFNPSQTLHDFWNDAQTLIPWPETEPTCGPIQAARHLYIVLRAAQEGHGCPHIQGIEDVSQWAAVTAMRAANASLR